MKRQLNPTNCYHLSFNIGFPNRFDRSHGRTGSYLLTEATLTAGQEAVDVHIFPFRMTDENMAAHAESEWIDFWRNLKTGHDLSEVEKLVPQSTVSGGRYVLLRQ